MTSPVRTSGTAPEDREDKSTAKRGLWGRLTGVGDRDQAAMSETLEGDRSDHVLTATDVDNLYRLVLGREAESAEAGAAWIGKPLSDAMAAFLGSMEFEERVCAPLANGLVPEINLDWLRYGAAAVRLAEVLPIDDDARLAIAAAKDWPSALTPLLLDPAVRPLVPSAPSDEALSRWAKQEAAQLAQLHRDVALVEGHYLLDASWYRRTYGLGPEISVAYDYLLNWRSGRDPSPFFSNHAYIDRNPDLRVAGVNPLMHWLTDGSAEGRAAPVPVPAGDPVPRPYLVLADLCDPLRDEPVPEAPASGVLISVLTPSFNTAPYLLHELYQTLRNQTYGRWQWVICDDGSSDPRTIATLRALAERDPRIMLRMERNGGIASATNHALEKADGDYVALVDHDDLLSRDMFAKAVAAIGASPEPVDILYTDEAKLLAGGVIDKPVLKPAWSPALLETTMYIGHLTIYRTALLRVTGGFRSAYDGTQDFDMALRMSAVASTVVHIPYVGYLWRAIEGSAALSYSAKSYAVERQHRAVEDHARKQWPSAAVRPGFLTGYWRTDYPLDRPLPSLSYVIPTAGRSRMVRGQSVDLLINCITSLERSAFYPEAEIVVVHNGDLSTEQLAFLGERPNVKLVLYADPVLNLSTKINLGVAAASGGYICLLNDDVEAISAGGGTQLIGYMEAHPKVGAIAPLALFEDGTVQHGGVMLGDDGPIHGGWGRPLDMDSHVFLHCRREQFAVTGAMLFVRRDVFLEVGGFAETLPLNYNDVDFCLKLRAQGLSCVIDPDVAIHHYEGASKIGTFRCERETLLARWPGLADPYFNPSHDQRSTQYQVAEHARPDPPDALAFEHWLDQRISRGRGIATGPRLTIGVSVYNQPKALLNEMVASVAMQTYGNFEFLILDNGSTKAETRGWVDSFSDRPNVRLWSVPENLGILGGQRALLEAAGGEFFLPIDADDYLTIDALAVIAEAIMANPDAHYFYSDEFKSDLTSRKFSPFFKPDYDPVAIANSCFPTHLMAWRAAFLREIGAYSDDRAAWCHDWDTIYRALAVGAEPIHVPELLYAWRINPGSTASAESGDKPETVASQAFVLEQAIAMRGLGKKLQVVPNRQAAGTGMWELDAVQPIADVARLSAWDIWDADDGIDRLLARADESAWVAIIAGRSDRQQAETLRALSAPALWDDRVGVVSGGLSTPDGQHVVGSGALFTPGGLLDPSAGETWSSGGYHGRLYCQRCIDVALPVDVLISSLRLREAIDYLVDRNVPPGADSLMVALGILAAREGWFVAMTPAVRLVLPAALRHVVPVDRPGLAAGMTSRWYNSENSVEYPFSPGDYRPAKLFGLG